MKIILAVFLKAKENLKNGKGIAYNETELNKLYSDAML